MIKSIFLGSTICVLLAVSVISYSRPFTQDPSKQRPQPQIQDAGKLGNSTQDSDSAAKQAESLRVGAVNETGAQTGAPPLRAPETFVATAYSLRGRTASGKPVAHGLIAADPRVLPLGTRVRLEAGSMSGEYLVADTGGAVKGRHVDIWTSSARDAMRFGKRAVKLTVLSFGPRRIRSTKAGAEARGKRT